MGVTAAPAIAANLATMFRRQLRALAQPAARQAFLFLVQTLKHSSAGPPCKTQTCQVGPQPQPVVSPARVGLGAS